MLGGLVGFCSVQDNGTGIADGGLPGPRRPQRTATSSRTLRGPVVMVALAIGCWSVTTLAQETMPERDYILRDNGIRCVRAPCANLDAVPVPSGNATPIVGYSVRSLGMTDAEGDALRGDLSAGLIVVHGRLVKTKEGLWMLDITRLGRRP